MANLPQLYWCCFGTGSRPEALVKPRRSSENTRLNSETICRLAPAQRTGIALELFLP